MKAIFSKSCEFVTALWYKMTKTINDMLGKEKCFPHTHFGTEIRVVNLQKCTFHYIVTYLTIITHYFYYSLYYNSFYYHYPLFWLFTDTFHPKWGPFKIYDMNTHVYNLYLHYNNHKYIYMHTLSISQPYHYYLAKTPAHWQELYTSIKCNN